MKDAGHFATAAGEGKGRIDTMEDRPLGDYADFAQNLADEAGRIARNGFGTVRARRKPDGSELTDADVAIQEMMVGAIRRAYPGHLILGEECGVFGGSAQEAEVAEWCWVTDPLDGTRNFAFGVPVFATAIALLHRGRPVVGIVKSLPSGDMFAAVQGGGVTHDGRKVSVGRAAVGERSLVGVQSTIHGPDGRIVIGLAGTAALRNLGSTALHMALVASGAFAAAVAWECRLWDVAAGWLLINEAGGVCTDWNGRPLAPFAGAAYAGCEVPFVAAAPQSHDQFLSRIQKARGCPPSGQA